RPWVSTIRRTRNNKSFALPAETGMPARPLIDKMLIMRLLDELVEYGLSDEEIEITLVRDGPVDLDLLAECKREHPAFNRHLYQNLPQDERRSRCILHRL